MKPNYRLNNIIMGAAASAEVFEVVELNRKGRIIDEASHSADCDPYSCTCNTQRERRKCTDCYCIGDISCTCDDKSCGCVGHCTCDSACHCGES